MRLGNVAIMMYLFSIGMVFFGYYVNELFPTTTLTEATTNMTGTKTHTFTSETLDGLKNNYQATIQQQPNPLLIFGDFITGLKIIFSIVSGIAIGDALVTSGIPFVDFHVQVLIALIFSVSSFFLWLHILTGRDT